MVFNFGKLSLFQLFFWHVNYESHHTFYFEFLSNVWPSDWIVFRFHFSESGYDNHSYHSTQPETTERMVG
jgi:hypothetical protein